MWRGPRGHWARAFVSAVSLHAHGDEKFRARDSYGNYPVRGHWPKAFLASARALSRKQWPRWHGSSGLFWAGGDSDWLVFTGLGILSLAVNSKNAISDDTIMELAKLANRRGKRATNEPSRPGNFPHHWLFRATVFDLDREQCMAIGAKLAAFKGNNTYGDAVRTIGRKLSGQDPVP